MGGIRVMIGNSQEINKIIFFKSYTHKERKKKREGAERKGGRKE